MLLTDFVPRRLVRERARRRTAEQYDTPFASLRELEALVVDLVRELACWREDQRAHARARALVRLRGGDGCTEARYHGKQIRERFPCACG